MQEVEKEMITRDNWIWMPHPAHFICSDKCKFFLSTKVGKYIISTVGEFWPERVSREIHAEIRDLAWHKKNNSLIGDEYDREYFDRFGYEEISCGRKYETMVFLSKKTTKEYGCEACPFIIESGENIDMDGYNKPEEAYRGHIKMCTKYSKK